MPNFFNAGIAGDGAAADDFANPYQAAPFSTRFSFSLSLYPLYICRFPAKKGHVF